MEPQPETTTPVRTKLSFFWTYFILTPVAILLLYVLSTGPVLLLQHQGKISQGNKFVKTLYEPLDWVYFETPLHKPLGLYLHLWVPEKFDQDGGFNLF